MIVELNQKSRLKIFLFLGAVAIGFFFVWFSYYLVSQLSSDELEKVQKVADAYKFIAENQNAPAKVQDTINYSGVKQTIQETKIPILLVDKNGNIQYKRNIEEKHEKDTAYLKSRFNKWKSIKIFYNDKDYQTIYYEEKPAITLLRYYPYVQILLISIFLIIAYIAFNSSRRYEQNKVWVGMAKETAHQIGTPLSSLMAWVDYLKHIDSKPDEEVISELEKDIYRLQVITERFSKIGSTPELAPYNLYDVIEEAIDYLKKRISKKVSISISEKSTKDGYASINKYLFDWVIENITKNAVDAMNGTGEIVFRIVEGSKNVYIDITDNGKGISRNNFNSVFSPGYTTKKRGWGLGLSLSKRIIENYHNGEIFVKDSEPGKGTTFRIKLKKVGA